MFAMEVFQYCLVQVKELLYSTRVIDPSNVNLITLDLDQSTCRIPSKVDFHMKVTSHGNNIIKTIVDEGASTCVRSLKCWERLGSPTLVQSHIVQNNLTDICSLLTNSLYPTLMNGVEK